MQKEIRIYITKFRDFHKIVNTPIRVKEDLIKVLLHIIKGILNRNSKDEGLGEVLVSINRSSRVYIVCREKDEIPSKYYSFTFPFFLQEDKEGDFIVKCKVTSEILSSELVDKLLVLIDKKWFSNIASGGVDKFAYDYLDEIENYCNAMCIDAYEMEQMYKAHWAIIKTLLTFEPGYLRYDYDLEHEDGEIHPLNHLDIHYESNSTFKLGFDKSVQIKERLEFEIFKDILENGKARKKCYQLK